MIRGVLGAVPSRLTEVGRFYLNPGYGKGAWLFQCIQLPEAIDGVPQKKALLFRVGEESVLEIIDLPDRSSVAALYDVHVRIDPTSISNNSNSSLFVFLVVGETPVICASNGGTGGQRRGWRLINLSNGTVMPSVEINDSVSFDRWSLVLDDDAGDELTVASFDACSPPKQA